MRWKFAVLGLALILAGISGCKQQCFLHECDYDHYHNLVSGTPSNLECDPNAGLDPVTAITPPPATVLDPDRDIRYMSLAECIAMALEHGSVGSQVQTSLGVSNDTLSSFAGGAFNIPPESIRVLALDPAIIGANIEGALSKFDARWITSSTWTTTDRPVGSALDVFQASSSGLNSINNNDVAVQSQLLKPLPTGGVAGITFRTDFQQTNLPARVNPSYRPALQFSMEQPLLRDFGVEINQLRTSHPGSIQNPFNATARFEGILITRLRFDQQRADFERSVNYMLVNVETAYWNLYGSYWNLYSREQALRQAYEAWKINKAKYDAGRVAIQDFAQSRQQYESFRAQRIQALGQVLETERQLRGLLLLPVEDGHRIVPSDAPNLAPYQPDWNLAMQECLTLRPELVLIREELKFRQLDLIRERNNLLPDLRATSSYDINGIGNRLDGPGSENAFRSMAANNNNNWSLGLRLDIPIGFREAHTTVRIARLNLARTYGTLREQELRAQRFLAQQYRSLFQQYELIRAQRAQREAAAQQLEARFRQYLAGTGTLDILLESQRVWADSLRDEYSAIAQYNSAMAGFEFAKGTIQQHDNVYIAEGALPQCAQVRAVEHERARSKALVLRERPNTGPNPFVTDSLPPGEPPTLPGLKETATSQAPTLPSVMKEPLSKDWSWIPKGNGVDAPEPGTLPNIASTPPAAPATKAPTAPVSTGKSTTAPVAAPTGSTKSTITAIPVPGSAGKSAKESLAVPTSAAKPTTNWLGLPTNSNKTTTVPSEIPVNAGKTSTNWLGLPTNSTKNTISPNEVPANPVKNTDAPPTLPTRSAVSGANDNVLPSLSTFGGSTSNATTPALPSLPTLTPAPKTAAPSTTSSLPSPSTTTKSGTLPAADDVVGGSTTTTDAKPPQMMRFTKDAAVMPASQPAPEGNTRSKSFWSR